ncbi:MAG: sulfotransferase family 2 domain-containing protein [Flavobacteriaceae bacterium]|nr:sulfotransferase family 2 domain-containing protein [Flavobacteriaceae bacterium]
MRNSLIFLHIPKNGGTTFHSILNRLYPRESTFTLTTVNKTRTNYKEFIKIQKEEEKRIKLLKGHAPFGMHRFMDPGTKYITFLRRPEERVISFYYYVLRKPNNKLFPTIKHGNLSLYDFVTQVNSTEVNNCQVQWISGIYDREDLMLEKALENIDNHFAFVGITEKFDESLVMLRKQLSWPIPYYTVKNKTSKRPMLETIDDKTLEAIRNYNQLDIQLYDIMYQRFNEQIEAEKPLSKELMELRLYNRIYSIPIGRKIAGSIKRSLKL